MGDRDHQCDRRDDQHQRRNDQAGDAEKSYDRLTLAGHQVYAAQRLRNPDHPRQADQNQRKRRQRRAKNILVDRPHRYRTIPAPANWNYSWRPIRAQGSPLVALPPSSQLTLYHPFDPSTKWLRHGTAGIWLIIALCGLPATGTLGSPAAD